MRQFICFLVAAAMFGGGLYIVWDGLFVASVILVRIVGVGLTLALIGGMWLWIDFVSPLLRRAGATPDAPQNGTNTSDPNNKT